MKPDLTASEIAKLMGVHVATVRRLARAGSLPGAYKVGSQWRFAREAIGRMRGPLTRATYHRDVRLSDLDAGGERDV